MKSRKTVEAPKLTARHPSVTLGQRATREDNFSIGRKLSVINVSETDVCSARGEGRDR